MRKKFYIWIAVLLCCSITYLLFISTQIKSPTSQLLESLKSINYEDKIFGWDFSFFDVGEVEIEDEPEISDLQAIRNLTKEEQKVKELYDFENSATIPLPFAPTNFQDIIHVLLTGDFRYTTGLVAVINSTLQTSLQPSLIRFHIVSFQEKRASLHEAILMELFPYSFHQFNFYQFNKSLVPFNLTAHQPGKDYLGKSIVYSRMFVAEMFPFLEKVIYLDQDVLLLKDIRKLWNIKLDGYPIAAVKSCKNISLFKSQFRYGKENPELKGFDPEECLFNTGSLFFLASY